MTPEVQPVGPGGSSSQLDVSARPDSLSRVPGEEPRTDPSDSPRYPSSSWTSHAHVSLINRLDPLWTLVDREEEEEAEGRRSQSYGRSLSHISEGSGDGVLAVSRASADTQEDMSLSSGMSISDIEMEISSRTPEPSGVAADPLPRRLSFSETPLTPQDGETQATPTSDPGAVHEDVDDVTYLARCVAVEEDRAVPDSGPEDDRAGVGGDAVDSGLGDALAAVASSLDDYRGQFPELQLLEDELKVLQVTLKVRGHTWTGGGRGRKGGQLHHC